ncbi:MAG: hypothetical protein WAU82_03405, partial [Candidatus Binatus sp.]
MKLAIPISSIWPSDGPRIAIRFCHPDVASNASGRTWLLASGQLRASEAGTGSEIAQRSLDSHWN